MVKGGRYDNLLLQFGKEAPAIGFCMIVDNILEALSRQKVSVEIPASVHTVTFRQDNYMQKLSEVKELRSRGIAAALVQEREER